MSTPLAAVMGLALCLGAGFAIQAAWLSDDAFISFRYAQNLIEGRGLVFNAGERVEGMTNLLWTLWISAGLGLGFSVASWANAWSIGAYLGTLLLLGAFHLRLRTLCGLRGLSWPLAMVLAALHPDWHAYATSGLETSLFTFLALAGFMLVTRQDSRPFVCAAAGVVLAAASLTRPDGLLFVGFSALFVVLAARDRFRSGAAFALAFAVVWGPATVWRIAYFGDFFPNSYYAKSAYAAWFDQGFVYLALYFARYWLLLLGVPAVGVLWWRRVRRSEASPSLEAMAAREGALALLFAGGYVFYVARVGGDFMYARFLIPATPFLLILLEIAFHRVAARRLHWEVGGGVLLACALWFSPEASAAAWKDSGIIREQQVYTPSRAARMDRSAAALRRAFAGLDVRVAFLGSEARLVYAARIPIAIESETGLTDPVIARQTLTRRGRVGHEKRAPADYLIEQRKAHFTFHPRAARVLDLDRWIPNVPIRIGPVRGRILHWDPELMDALAKRGAIFENFPETLDRYLHDMQERTPEQRARDWSRFRRFYFDHVEDEDRRSRFEAGLNQTGPPS